MKHLLCHLGIAVDALVILETCLLDMACLNHTLTNLLAGLAWLHLTQLREGYGLYLAMDVDAVEEGTGDLVHVTLNLTWRTHAVVVGVAIVAAGTGVHGGHEHKGGRVGHAVFGTRHGDDAVFQRLAHDLEDATLELRQLVEEEYTIVGQ